MTVSTGFLKGDRTVKNVLIVLAAVAILALFVLLPGCANLNTENVEAFTTLIDKIDARASGTVDDPALKFFIYTEQGVGVRIDGIHVQGSGQGDSESQPTRAE